MPRHRIGPRPLLIAAEGLEGAGKSVELDRLARWLERKGRSVAVERWDPSSLVEAAAANPRLRSALTPRVAALLAAADAARRIESDVRRPLGRGAVVLADRYAWTAIAREVARGLDASWTSSLYRAVPVPDLVIFFEQPAALALSVALERHGASARAPAISSAFQPFLERMVAAYDRLVEGAPSGGLGPWAVPVVRVKSRGQGGEGTVDLRAAVRPLLASVGVAA